MTFTEEFSIPAEEVKAASENCMEGTYPMPETDMQNERAKKL